MTKLTKNSDMALFATSEIFDVPNLKLQKFLTWQIVPRQNCPPFFFFFFFFPFPPFKKQISFFFFLHINY
jgi:hypothetical protein